MPRPRRSDPEPVLKRVGQRIKKLRLFLDMTQEVLAARAGMQPETISRIETASVFADVATLHRVAVGLGVEVGDLMDSAHVLPTPHLAAREFDLLVVYRSLEDQERDVIDRMLDVLRPKSKKKAAR